MDLIPVMDLLGSAVVRGVAGRRREYRPIESRLSRSSQPADVASALFDLGLPTIYVADLDAIERGQPNWGAYREMLAARPTMNWLLDAGLTSVETAQRLLDSDIATAIDGFVAGLESLPGPEILAKLLKTVGPERLVFSLDLKGGEPLLPREHSWPTRSPLEIALAARKLGAQRMIVLDLAAVGCGQGVPTLSLVAQLRRRCVDSQIVAGGGVRSIDDLSALEVAGCSAALVASALHDQSISMDEWRAWREARARRS